MSADILIIDDKPEQIQAIDTVLREAGYNVRAARDGRGGLRAAQTTIPDLILLDVNLPDVDGFSVCRQLQSEGNLANAAVVFLSAYEDVDFKAHAFEAGGSDYITKPFDATELLVRVRHQLERIYLRKQLQERARLGAREHIARELHDSVNQTLFVLRTTVQSMMMDADGLPPDLHDQLQHVNMLSKSALAEMRTLLNELHPAQMQNTPIGKLLTLLVDAFRLRIDADLDVAIVDADLPETVKITFYRIAQEALNNIAKYAGATWVRFSFLDEADKYRLILQDNGCGFDPAHVNGGMGLHTMRSRAEQSGMEITIDTAPGQGTRIGAVWRCHTP